MIDWKRKFASRKFWMGAAGAITGAVLAFKGGSTEEIISGVVMAIGSIVAYIIGEAYADGQHSEDEDAE